MKSICFLLGKHLVNCCLFHLFIHVIIDSSLESLRYVFGVSECFHLFIIFTDIDSSGFT